MKRSGIDLLSPKQPSKRLVHRVESRSSDFQASLPSSSQELASSISNITEKSVGDLSASEKGRWREYEDDPDGFFDHLDLPTASKDYLRRRYRFNEENENQNLKEFLFSATTNDLSRIKQIVERSNKGIQWSLLDLNGSTEMTEGSFDDLVFCWLESKKINRGVAIECRAEYEEMFCRLLPVDVKPGEEMLDIAASAFHGEEKPTRDGRLASEAIYRKIVHYYNSYPCGNYLAPYTSIVGPSGIGKSFMVSQMAYGYGLYVVYSNFAEKGKLPYPGRSVFADILPHNETRTVQAAFWESYIMVAMCDVELCRRVGISPGGFYYLQTMKIYRNYQEDFSKRLANFFQSYRDIHRLLGGPNQKKLAEILQANIEVSEKTLESWRPHLVKNNHNPSATATTDGDVPNALICLDEARTLLEGEGSPSFRSFRDAIRRRFARTSKMGTLNLTKSQGDYFALILDTTSKVANFSPPMMKDHSQKAHREVGGLLFAPLFAIDTINIFGKNNKNGYPDGSDEATIDMFHFGRPLWGARMARSESLYEVMELAKQKLQGQGPSYLTALLSYRLSFYITNNALAEDLVSGWMRYILYINEGRDMLRTSQPSEPILAHTSAFFMSDPATRLQVVQQFARISFEGSINTGDMGEIVAAIILFLTYDGVLHNEVQHLPAAVPFKGFIVGLFGSQVADQIMECSFTDAEMSLVCSDGKVLCNHFFTLEETPTNMTLKNAFLHGAGIILPDRFPGADLLIPIRLPGGDMTFFGIQVKNREKDSYSSSLREETLRSFSKAAQVISPDMPFVGLTMGLRGEQRTSEIQSVGIVHPPKATGHSTRSTISASTGYNWPKKNKRILLLAVGLNETVYPNITSCRGEKSPESEALLPLLKSLLNCKPGITLPEDADVGYADRVRSLDV